MGSLRFIIKLVLRQLIHSPGRGLAAIAGIMTSTCAVIWIVSAYDGLISQFDENAGKYLGRYDLLITPKSAPGSVSFISQALIDHLRNDSGILELNPVNQSRVSIKRIAKPDDKKRAPSALDLVIGSNPPVFGAPPIEPILVGTPAPEEPYQLVQGQWLSERRNDQSIVLTSGAAKQIGVSISDEVHVTTFANQVKLMVVGIVKQPPITPSLSKRPSKKLEKSKAKETSSSSQSSKFESKLGVPTPWVEGSAVNAAYVRPGMAAKINGFPFKPTLLQVALRDTVEVAQFSDLWKTRFNEAKPALEIIDYSRVRDGLGSSRSITTQKAQAFTSASMACLAAVFIIFTLLSMGVSERTREIALLRTIAAGKMQVVGIVVGEALVLAITGWLFGIMTSHLLIWLGSHWLPTFFEAESNLGWTCLWLTFAAVFLGSLLASIIPAWRATRIEPLDAVVAARISSPSCRFYWWTSSIGLILVGCALASVFLLTLPPKWHLWCYAILTYPALITGTALLTPAFILLTQKTFGTIFAKLFGLSPKLLKNQLSQNTWKSIGATISLSIGLGLFVSTHVWGYSMLAPFLPSKWLPDMLVSFQPNGLDETGIDLVRKTEGVQSDEVLPLAIEQAKFDWGAAGKPQLVNYDNAVLFGIDPDQGFGGESPFLDVDFVQGNPESVAKKLNEGPNCVISQSFSRASSRGVGDWLSFVPPNSKDPNARIRYQVVGVVALPGWQWITKFSGVRRHFVRTSCMMFVNRKTVQKDFHLLRPEFCWANLKNGANADQVRKSMQKIAEKKSGGSFLTSNFGQVQSYRPFARSTSTKKVNRAINLLADSTIWTMSMIPLLTLIIMSMAVVHVVASSVRARTWEFGVLRAIGVGRWQLVRIVFVETLLIGFSACSLSLFFGILAGWCGVAMASYGYWGGFIGRPVFLVPWGPISLGFAIAIGLCIVAAIWATWRLSRAEPLSLLSAGRAAR